MAEPEKTISQAFDEFLDKVFPSSFTPKYDGKCQHSGCEQEGLSYGFPKLEDTDNPPTQIYCSTHAKAHGFCIGCGRFYGGVESFEFGDSSFCDDCQSLDDYSDVDDCWDLSDEAEYY